MAFSPRLPVGFLLKRARLGILSKPPRVPSRLAAAAVHAPAFSRCRTRFRPAAHSKKEKSPQMRALSLGDDSLQVVDVLDEVTDGGEAFRLAEVDAALLLEVADELDHVQGVDSQVFEGGVFGHVLGVDVEVRFENFFNGIKRSH